MSWRTRAFHEMYPNRARERLSQSRAAFPRQRGLACSRGFLFGYFIIITFFVITSPLSNRMYKNIPGRFPNYKGEPQDILFQTTFVYDLGDGVETIISSLTEKYQHRIDSKQYSKNENEWGGYSQMRGIISGIKLEQRLACLIDSLSSTAINSE